MADIVRGSVGGACINNYWVIQIVVIVTWGCLLKKRILFFSNKQFSGFVTWHLLPPDFYIFYFYK